MDETIRELVEAAKEVVEWGTPADKVPSVPPPYIRVSKAAYQRLVRALHLVDEPPQCRCAGTCSFSNPCISCLLHQQGSRAISGQHLCEASPLGWCMYEESDVGYSHCIYCSKPERR